MTDLAAHLDALVAAGMPRAWDDLSALVACRSVYDPAVEPVSECLRAADLTAELLREVGLDVIEVAAPDGAQCVVGTAPGPAGAPTVLLYAHHDVQPAGAASAWTSAPFELTVRGERWYGRGSADCKGNLVAHLVALRALREALGHWPVSIRVVVEGSEEQNGPGMVELVALRPELVAADVVVIADSGNIAVGVPTVTTTLRGTGSVVVTVRTMAGQVHSGMYGGAAPDALHALLVALTSLRDASGRTTVDGLPDGPQWTGAPYPQERLREDAEVLDGVEVLGVDDDGSVADAVWSAPSVTVIAIDCQRVDGAIGAIAHEARAVVGLRVPPEMDAVGAQAALMAHLRSHVPWGAQVEVAAMSATQPFRARTDGPAWAALERALERAYGAPVQRIGEGGSIPLTTAIAEAHPRAEIVMLGVEEPQCRIHAPDESVHPEEIRRTALAEALLIADLGGRS